VPEQLEFFTIPSPCRGVCRSDARGYCVGCMRSRQERFDWMVMDNHQKKDVLRLCRQRYLRQMKSVTTAEPNSPEPEQPSLF